MKLFRKYVLILLWFCYLMVAPLTLFLRGFLLHRKVLPFHSQCSDFNESQCNGSVCPDVFGESVYFGPLGLSPDLSAQSQLCLPPKTNAKVILLIIDALKYDFIAYSPDPKHQQLAYKNKMPVIHRLVEKSSAKMYKFMADPPTTTLQRLNGLTTGSLPTFIDIGANFATSEISEDNLIDQMLKYNKSIVMLGDDTWTQLYPKRFLRSFPFPSFNVWDLDTVDTGILDNLSSEINKRDWDMIIAHFLGVDHCGHRYGPSHPEMSRKLSEMNTAIENVINIMDNNTVLIVMGDHGMTMSGDHGGDSVEELTAALFIFSMDERLISTLVSADKVRQVDLVPTLSSVFGVPIPFSNLGTTLIDVKWDKSPQLLWKRDLLNLFTNVRQVTSYIKEYSKENSQLSTDKLRALLEEFKALKNEFSNVASEEDLKNLVKSYKKYLNTIRELCEEVWVTFDSLSMSRGLVLMFLVLSLIYIIVDAIPSVIFQDLIDNSLLLYVICFMIISSCSAFCFWSFKIVENLELSIYFFTCTSSLLILTFLVITNWTYVSESWYKKSQTKGVLDVIGRGFILIGTFSIFSNSYIIEESRVLYYLCISLLWLSVLTMKPDAKSGATRGQMILAMLLLNIVLRYSTVYWQCREENYADCSYVKPSLSSFSAVFYILFFSSFVIAARRALKSMGNLVGTSFNIIMSRYGPLLCIISSGCYWLLSSLPYDIKTKLFLPWQMELFPRIVLGTTLLSILIIYAQPLCIYYLSNRLSPQENHAIPSLFNKLKDVLVSEPKLDDDCPVVYGLATVYSAAFINIAVPLCFLAAILIGESRAPSSLAMMVSLIGIVIVSSVIKHSRAKKKDDLYSSPWWSVVVWGMSSAYFFYGTGHQPTFPSIDWNVVRLFGNIISTFIPGLLVLSATYISQIIHAMLLPVLLLAPFTLNVVWPKVVPVKLGLSKGEIMFYEVENVRRRETFALIVKYLLFLGFRVFICMLSSSVHSRHLMVWKIFAPKLIFESVGFIVSLPFLTLTFLLVERISSRTEHFINECVLSKRLGL